MKRRMTAALVILGFAAHAEGAFARGVNASLCQEGERQLFSCPIGRKLVSICGAGAQAKYRFGRKTHVELELAHPTFAQTAYSGGGESQIAFPSRNYAYVVYDRMIRTNFSPNGTNDPKMTQGVMILKDGRRLSDRTCGGLTDGGDVYAAGKGMPAGEIVPP